MLIDVLDSVMIEPGKCPTLPGHPNIFHRSVVVEFFLQFVFTDSTSKITNKYSVPAVGFVINCHFVAEKEEINKQKAERGSALSPLLSREHAVLQVAKQAPPAHHPSTKRAPRQNSHT